MALDQNRLSIRLSIDTNLVEPSRGGKEMAQLRSLEADAWIQIFRASTMDAELETASDPAKRRELLSMAAPLQSQIGVWVLDHSRLGLDTMLGGQQDATLWDQLWQTLNPGRDRATARRNHVKDAMHVHTAMRYGNDGFVTLDGGLLDRAEAVRASFNGFNIWTPTEALAYVERRKHRYELRKRAPG